MIRWIYSGRFRSVTVCSPRLNWILRGLRSHHKKPPMILPWPSLPTPSSRILFGPVLKRVRLNLIWPQSWLQTPPRPPPLLLPLLLLLLPPRTQGIRWTPVHRPLRRSMTVLWDRMKWFKESRLLVRPRTRCSALNSG